MPDKGQRSCLGIALALAGAGLSGLFLSNLTFGLGFEIPDNLPFIGNLDEVVVSAIFFSCLSYLGINVVPTWQRRTFPREDDPPRLPPAS